MSSDGKIERTVTVMPQVKSLQHFFYDATFDSRRVIEIAPVSGTSIHGLALELIEGG